MLKIRDATRPDTIKGAQMQISEFKKQLFLFDKALEKMHKEKLGKQEYMKIQKDPTVSQAINDVTSLFDNSVSQM